MQRAVAMLVLFVGVGLASASGALNGANLTEYRSAQWTIGKYEAVLATTDESDRAEMIAELRSLGLVGEERGLPEQIRDAHTALGTKAELMIAALRADGLISRDPTMAQSRAEATMRLEDLQRLARAQAAHVEAGAPQAAPEPSSTAEPNASATLPPPPSSLDEGLAAEWTLLQRAVAGEDEAILALRDAGVVHAPASAEQVRELLDDPKQQQRAVDVLVEAELISAPETIEARLESVRTSAPLPEPTTRLAQWWSHGGIPWGVGVLLIIVGALMARRQDTLSQSGKGATTTDTVDFKATVTTVLERLDQLIVELADLPLDAEVPELRERIDAIQLELIDPVVEQRGRLISRHGIAVFAEYFSPFSSGERNLARTWSALTDGHSPTARHAAARARSAFAQAHRSYMKADAKR